MKKYYLLIQDCDEHGHFSAWIRPVTNCDNIASIVAGIPGIIAANIYHTKKECNIVCDMLNKHWSADGKYKWDYMPDGITPAPF